MDIRTRVSEIYGNLGPERLGIDIYYGLVAIIGFAIAHATEHAQRHKLDYWEQITQAGPATFFGYLFGCLAIFFPTEILVTVPILVNFCALSILSESFSISASVQIFLYGIFVGKGYGWRSTILIITAGTLLSPLISIKMTSLRYKDEFLIKVALASCAQLIFYACSYLKKGIIPANTIIRAYYSVASYFPTPLRRISSALFADYCQQNGWDEELARFENPDESVVEETVEEPVEEPVFDHYFENPEDMRKFPLQFLKMLPNLLVPGVRIAHGTCTLHNVKLTEEGERSKNRKSPEFAVMEHIARARSGSPRLERKHMNLASYGATGVRICEEKGYVKFENEFAVPGRTAWKYDRTQADLLSFDSHNSPRPDHSRQVELMSRGLISGIIKVSGQYVVEGHAKMPFDIQIKDEKGFFVAPPQHPV